MAGKSFYRGLRSGTFKEMDRFFHTPVGRAILETKFQDKPVFQVCLRDNYLNVYWRGCSVLRYEPDARENTFIIHRKYTEAKGTHIKTNEYIRLIPSEGDRDLVWRACSRGRWISHQQLMPFFCRIRTRIITGWRICCPEIRLYSAERIALSSSD